MHGATDDMPFRQLLKMVPRLVFDAMDLVPVFHELLKHGCNVASSRRVREVQVAVCKVNQRLEGVVRVCVVCSVLALR